MKLLAMTDLDHVTVEARQLWQLLDHCISDEWITLGSLGDHLGPIARWMPLQSWRPLFHELGTHRLLAHRVNKGVIEISRWQDRCVQGAFDLAQSPKLRAAMLFNYLDWTPFTWDRWQDTCLYAGIETEALWQLNSIYIQCHAQNMVESRDQGRQIKATDELVLWSNSKRTT